MSVLKRIERDQRAAELSSVEAMIGRLADEDLITRMSLEARRDEIAEELAAQADQPDATIASAALFFGGKPVAASRGIEVEFGGNAVTTFQDLVAKMMAQEVGPLAPFGAVPNKGAAALHITNVVRGSFGFLLEEVAPQGQAVDTSLKIAVDNATRLLAVFGETDEERFRAAIETVDERTLATARDFFTLMRGNSAIFRIRAGERDQAFGSEAVTRAAERASTTRVLEVEEQIAGQLNGVLPDAHVFEFRTTGTRGTIRGNVDRNLSASTLAGMNRDAVNRDALATVKVRKVLRNDEIVREGFTLLKLEPKSDDHSLAPATAV